MYWSLIGYVQSLEGDLHGGATMSCWAVCTDCAKLGRNGATTASHVVDGLLVILEAVRQRNCEEPIDLRVSGWSLESLTPARPSCVLGGHMVVTEVGSQFCMLLHGIDIPGFTILTKPILTHEMDINSGLMMIQTNTNICMMFGMRCKESMATL